MPRQTPLRKILTELRAETGETRADMAKALGVSYTLAFAVESGRQPLAMNYAKKLVRHFGPVPALQEAIMEQIAQVRFVLPSPNANPNTNAHRHQRQFLYTLATASASGPLPEGVWQALENTLEMYS